MWVGVWIGLRPLQSRPPTDLGATPALATAGNAPITRTASAHVYVFMLDEVALHPQIAARRLFERGESRHAPHLGEHTDELLREIGVDPAGVDELKAQGVI